MIKKLLFIFFGLVGLVLLFGRTSRRARKSVGIIGGAYGPTMIIISKKRQGME